MSKELIPAQRHALIRERLQTHKVVNNAELCELLGVSEATVRRDLEWLEAQDFLERTHGGAILSQQMKLEPEYATRALSHPEEKRRIGAAAAALIEDGDTIFLNSGTTTTEVVRHIPSGARITIVTNNVSAALEVHGADYELILLGGTFTARSNSVVGHFAVENLRQMYAVKTLLGVDGMSIKYGCTVPSNAEAELMHLMIERTRGDVIVVSDHSKWGVVSNFEVARWDQIHTLVTDEGIDVSARAELAARNIRVLVADAQRAAGGNSRTST
jgi:DeoR family transcriptional regulator, fructose operon transcriptional repressor